MLVVNHALLLANAASGAKAETLARLGDTRTNCTVGNGRLDEWDIDGMLVGLRSVYPVSFAAGDLGPLQELDPEELIDRAVADVAALGGTPRFRHACNSAALLRAATASEDLLLYPFYLRYARDGWTPDARRAGCCSPRHCRDSRPTRLPSAHPG